MGSAVRPGVVNRGTAAGVIEFYLAGKCRAARRLDLARIFHHRMTRAQILRGPLA